ncbi:MAG: holo-ACP synthase [Treponema sp.]|nr:holo-ACP synthase [Treponema sp.]
MITGVGIDIVEVKRMERWLNNSSLLERYFHSEEIALAYARKNSAALTLSARFAAKEAFGKALGTGLAQLALKDIMVLNRENGKPYILLTGTAQKAFESSGANRMHISLSHERDNAIAIIILERA